VGNKTGYDNLPPQLKARLAHADTLSKYYYQTVNERFAELIGRVGDNPSEAEVRTVLRQIKADLKNIHKNGKDFIQPGKTPRASDLP